MESDMALPLEMGPMGPQMPPDIDIESQVLSHPNILGACSAFLETRIPAGSALNCWGRCAKGTAVKKKVGEHHFWLVVSNMAG